MGGHDPGKAERASKLLRLRVWRARILREKHSIALSDPFAGLFLMICRRANRSGKMAGKACDANPAAPVLEIQHEQTGSSLWHKGTGSVILKCAVGGVVIDLMLTWPYRADCEVSP